MALINWDSELSVGVRELDEQHKKLVSLINTLHDSLAAGKGSSVVSETISNLAAYAKVHFKTEEEILQRLQYPDLSGQQREHASFVKEINKFYKNMESQKFKIPLDVLNFMKIWLITHIQTSDKEYGPFLNSKNVY